MIVRRLLSAVVITALALPVFADNTLIPADRTRLLVVNGEDAKSMKIDTKAGIPMGNGLNQVVFQVRTLVRDGNDNRLYTSSPYIMSFRLEGDQTYKIQPPSLRTTRDTSNFERAPQEGFSLIDEKGNSAPFEFATYNKSSLMLSNITNDIREFNQTDDPAAVKELAGTSAIAATAATTVAVAQVPAQMSAPQPAPAAEAAAPASESMLKYWYNQADQDTRNRFLQWVAEQH